MNTSRKFAAYVFAAFLCGSASVAVGQVPTTTAPGTDVTTPTTTVVDRDGFDWGWLGLLGLIGLAGLMRRERSHEVHHRAGIGTTTTR